MGRLLDKAFAEAAKLPPDAQDRFALFILEELQSDSLWDEAFARSQDILAAMADEALEEHHRGETEPLDPNL